jgi:peptidylprolyl isomerase
VTPLPRVDVRATAPALPNVGDRALLARTTSPACPDASPAAVVHVDPPPDVGAAPGYATVTSSGLATCVVRGGSGDVHPSPDDTVVVRYVGWAPTGVSFDSSLGRGDTATFPLRHLIRGWVEGVPMMVIGEIRRFWIPAALAYQGRAGPTGGMLVFDVELVGIGAPTP